MIHDQTITNGETRLAAELGIEDWLAAGLIVPFRIYHTTIHYLDPAGSEVSIENPFVHHHNETLTGIGDPWLYGRVARMTNGFLVGGRLGVTIPLGRTVEDPFVLGDMGLPHEHSQFGTGTFGFVGGIEVSRRFGRLRVDASALTLQTVYDNSHGYRAGDRYAAAVGTSVALGDKLRLRATVESVWETAETWGGIVHTDDGNIGRTDVLAGLEATWLATDNWHVALSVKVPTYVHVEGGQLDALGFVGVSVGTHLRAFGPAREHEHHDHDEHDHEDGHDHGGEHADDVAAVDWTGLDKVDVVTDGSVVPLEPVRGKITVFDFWATWCKPCRIVDRELAEVVRQHPDDIAVRQIDIVDADSPASRTYLGDRTIPHLKVFGRDGKLLWERSAPPLQLVADVETAITTTAITTTATTAPPVTTAPPTKAAPPPPRPAKRVAIEITEAGYVPARIEIDHGVPTVLVFTRKTDKTCATDVHFKLPDGARVDKQLPRDTPVEIPVTIDRAGTITYACGMDMIHGTIVVR